MQSDRTAHLLSTICDLEELRDQTERSLTLLRSLAFSLGGFNGEEVRNDRDKSASSCNTSAAETPTTQTPLEAHKAANPYTGVRSKKTGWTKILLAKLQEDPTAAHTLSGLRGYVNDPGPTNEIAFIHTVSAWVRRKILQREGRGRRALYRLHPSYVVGNRVVTNQNQNQKEQNYENEIQSMGGASALCERMGPTGSSGTGPKKPLFHVGGSGTNGTD